MELQVTPGELLPDVPRPPAPGTSVRAGINQELRLVELLLRSGHLSDADLERARAVSAANQLPLALVLVSEGLVTESELAATLAEYVGAPFVDLADFPIDAAATRLVTDTLCRRYEAIPVGWSEGRLMVAMADPSDVVAVDDMRAMTGADIQVLAATRTAILDILPRYHRFDSEAENVTAEAAIAFAGESDLASVKEIYEDAPIVRLVNMIITQAAVDRASDIHIEPGEHEVRIRYRIDGVLHQVMSPPKTIQAGIISRLKVMANLNIAERRLPQDGRITTTLSGRTVDLRVATLPTMHGEKIVMRILDQSTALLRLTDLGFLPGNMARYERSFRKPYGTVLVTGPTGSGKSTTLYSTLNALNESTKNIITVEDPVEYQLTGINQVQVNNKAGLTFATALRSILRSDPDILLVGEIRDRETAVIAVESALTGHMVLSTLHTNDAASTPARLIEMGVEPFLVGSALDCVVAQRLARRLCDRCKVAYQPERSELDAIGWDFQTHPDTDLPTLMRPGGCGTCSGTGYYGRFALQEVMEVTEEMERVIVERGHTDEIRKLAIADGMLPLRQSGLLQAARGLTSVEEILRVTA